MPVVRELTELPRGFSRRAEYHKVSLDESNLLFEIDPQAVSDSDYAKLVRRSQIFKSDLISGCGFATPTRGHYGTKKGKIFYLSDKDKDLRGHGQYYPIFRMYVDFNDGIEPRWYAISKDQIFTSMNDGVPYGEGLHRAFLEVRQALSGEAVAA